MIAIEISEPGGPEVLRAVERPVPEPGPHEVLIRVEAAGVARADLLQRQGKYPPPPGASDIPGLDVAGVVEADSGTFKAGDRVCAILTGGGYAQFCVAPIEQVLPVPAGWSTIEAATLPENLFTAYDNLVLRGGMKAGETVLVHGGASGVGTTAVMLAKAVGAQVIATAGTNSKCDAVRQLGASAAINYRDADFVSELKTLTAGRGADVILDMVGGEYLERNLDALATEGRLVIIATQRGRTATLDIAKLMIKRARVMGSTMRARTPAQKGSVADALRRNIWPLLPAKDAIKPVIDCTFLLEQAAAAHARLEEGNHVGKIVLVS